MIRIVDVPKGRALEDYESYASLYWAVKEFKTESSIFVPKLQNRKIWMINSTETGGGVAEMLPRLVSVMRQIGLDIDWAVMETDKSAFFSLTKKIHNNIHGKGDPYFDEDDRKIYEQVNFENAKELLALIGPEDFVVIHDPQPMGMAEILRSKYPNLKLIWRCHIGLDEETEQTINAWNFLGKYFRHFDYQVYSAPEYIPKNLTGHVSVVHPSIDPLTAKSKELTTHRISGILSRAGLIPDLHPTVTEPFVAKAQRLQVNGKFESALLPEDMGLLYRPIITQVSRWDRLKGFFPLIEGFAMMKKKLDDWNNGPEKLKEPVRICRLVLAGPDPEAVKDDPEGMEVLNELIDYYVNLPKQIQDDIALLVLPMKSTEENALIVNAIQRCSTVIVQNSLREGFGLTATEAMWKVKPVMVSNACGLRQQVRDQIDGRMIDNAEDAEMVAKTLMEMLADPDQRDVWASNAQRRVIDKFLIMTHVKNWLAVFDSTLKNVAIT
ncbi:MAG: glycosyltransferase [Cyclobacteriaceae bacterium]